MQLTTCLWFNGRAREAANFYTSIFPDSAVADNWIAPTDTPGSGGSTSVGTLQITGTLVYQSAHTISVTVSPSITGSVAFSQNGRPIPGCTAVALNTSTSTATCAWKPANLGSVSITAIFTPKSNLYTASPAKVISVVIKPR